MPTRSSAGGRYGEKKGGGGGKSERTRSLGSELHHQNCSDHDDTRHFISCLFPEIRGQTSHCTPLNDFSSSHKGFFFKIKFAVCHLVLPHFICSRVLFYLFDLFLWLYPDSAPPHAVWQIRFFRFMLFLYVLLQLCFPCEALCHLEALHRQSFILCYLS